MKLSTRGRYGARLMLDLALHYGEGNIILRDIAKRQEISNKYLGSLVPPLKKAGLINSSRGAHGGYTLAKPPEEITLREIIVAVEGNIALAECVPTPSVCHRSNSCVARDIWDQVSEVILRTLESITLRDMVNQHWQKQEILNPIYNI